MACLYSSMSWQGGRISLVRASGQKSSLILSTAPPGFVFEDSVLGVVLANLVLLLRQSVDWFEDLVEMMTKFNQDMYTKMRAKKNEPLSTLGKRRVRVVDQGLPAALAANVTVPTRVASLATSVEEITLLKKKARVVKGKEKASSRSSCVWDDVDLTQTRAQEVFSNDELNTFSGVPPNEIGVLGETIHITLEYLSQEARVSSTKVKAKGLEVELLKRKKDLIAAMDEANTTKEKAKVLSNVMRAKRQLTLEKDEQLQAAKERTKKYNTVLFSWYYKGFELLRRFLVKHPIGVDLEELDLEVVDKEMVVDEAAQSSQAVQDPVATPEGDTPKPIDVDGREAAI
ncbi:hypothetical protein SO802_018613 [Lithocarpus litseifolius]|uniref:Uncharacterized protein n=1 Tax=Lithocarpus litseifolius TaxID=425828 RepID=A0AAW2CPP3_9ROSI